MEGMDEVVEICRDLIRIDTTNYGSDDGPGERKAAEHVAGLLEEVGHRDPALRERAGAGVACSHGGEATARGPTRCSCTATSTSCRRRRRTGRSTRSAARCRTDRAAHVWGRGAVDMKDFDAMLLAVVRERQRTGRVPDRPIVLCFTADEEAGGHLGAEVMVRDHREEFEGCTEAVGEVGGWSTTVRGRRLYLIEAAEKGMAWMRLTARGRAGHGSMINPDNAVTRIAAAVARIGAHEWPVRLTPTMRTLLGTVGELAGTEVTPENARDLVEEFGGATRMLGAVLSNTTNPTMLGAGYKVNVDPDRGDRARRRPVPAGLRGRVLPRPWPSCAATTSASTTSPTSRRGRRRTTARWSTR